jgi:hypothetical protein
MNGTRYLHRCALRYPRTASEAFRDAAYGAAIENPIPSFWQRVLRHIREVLS